MKKNKVLIFDFDGTIADTMPILIDIYNKISIDFNSKKISNEDIERLRKLSIRKLLKELNISKIKFPFIVKKAKKKLKDVILEIDVISDMDNLIKILNSQGYILGILTSNTVENVNIFLKNHKMRKEFSFINSSGSLFGKAKVLNNLIDKYKLDKKNIIYIGDEVRDIEASKSVGINVIGVTWGLNSYEALLSAKPSSIANSTEELFKLIKKN